MKDQIESSVLKENVRDSLKLLDDLIDHNRFSVSLFEGQLLRNQLVIIGTLIEILRKLDDQSNA